MKSKILFLIVFLGFYSHANAGIEHLLPKPQKITVNETSSPFSLSNVGIVASTLQAEINTWVVEECGGTVVSENSANVIELKMVASITGAEFQAEAYNLEVSDNKITIKATTRQGAYWALQTLKQLANGTKGSVSIPACTIVDWPAFRIRGYMQDIGRSYMDFEEIKKEIAILSRYKINVFHWHLTENQGWRLESKLYPQLNANAAFTRHIGKYYTMAQARELVQWCKDHGVLLIPEIDMPGHSEAFTRAMGFNMQTTQGLAVMKNLVTEIIDSCFSTSPVLHIGTDEVTMTMSNFVPEMVALIRAKGVKVGTWSRGYEGFNPADLGLTQLWASSGKMIPGTPNVDSRYHYINHYDTYADVVGIYNSSILDVAKGSADHAGVIMAVWNDRLTNSDQDIVIQNGVYPALLATAERAWLGGGTYITRKGVMLDAPNTTEFLNFADWERRFLYHKAHHLKNEPIAYFKQTNIQWRITDAFPNNGNLSASFPPETTQTTTAVADSYTYNGNNYGSKKAIGGGIYLRHVWGTLIPTFYSNPQANSTAYAYTWVYSPINQTVGANIEFQNYGRSEADIPARQGKWDYKESRIWINDKEVLPPTWTSQHTSRNNEIALTNENASARPPIAVDLKQGWNKIFMKLPVGAFSISQVRLVKWMFSCVLVDLDGKNAVEGLIYSPDKNLNPSADVLISAIDDANAFRNASEAGNQPGEYPQAALDALDIAIASANKVKSEGTSEAEFNQSVIELNAALTKFKSALNLPIASTDELTVFYSMHTPYRENRYLSFSGNNSNLIGEAYSANADRQLWKLQALSDGKLAIVSKVSESYISPNSQNNTAINTLPISTNTLGWTFTPTHTNKTFIISSNDVQLNQTNAGLGYKVYNWGGGTNLTDTGCRYIIKEISRKENSTATVNVLSNQISIWVDNGQVFVSGTDEKPELYSTLGVKLADSAPLKSGVVIAKVGSYTKKLIVK